LSAGLAPGLERVVRLRRCGHCCGC